MTNQIAYLRAPIMQLYAPRRPHYIYHLVVSALALAIAVASITRRRRRYRVSRFSYLVRYPSSSLLL